MPSNLSLFFLVLFLLIVCLPGNGVYAFGAGNIPSFAYMEGKAFRHGDIEDTLADLIKKYGGGMAMLGSLVGKKGTKFGGLDIKRVYFGNWLRDYSQAVDVAGLEKLPLQTIMNLCMVLGFMAHGYATNEFEVTIERLGVYLPTEHIDNPKGYGQGKDARKFDPRLRGPVDPRELEIDMRTGMKNYIANEDGNWDTSKALVRRVLEKCIHHGRLQRANGQKQDEYEAYRLLGSALHTLEDFAAHSNFCELSLVSMGYTQVFTHVGDSARIQAPGGKWVAPLVTGTFGSSDFIYSLLGEATDHISEASVTDLNAELGKAKAKAASGDRSGPGTRNTSTFSLLHDLMSTIPSGGGTEMKRDLDEMQRIRAETDSGAGRPPEQLNPQELHRKLWAILSLRDRIVKTIEQIIEKIPGLGPLIEKIQDGITVFVFTTLEPLVKPLMKAATQGLMTASGEVIDRNDQYAVFNIPHATDPTHSFLSKDHFNLILNEPAGHLAKVIVAHSVELVVKSWDDPNMNVHHVTNEILQCLFHPDFHNRNSKIQNEMMRYMQTWVNELGANKHSVLDRLTKEATMNHKNVRASGKDGRAPAAGSHTYNAGHQAQSHIQGYIQTIPGVAQVQSLSGKIHGSSAPGGNPYGQDYQQGHSSHHHGARHESHHETHNEAHHGRHHEPHHEPHHEAHHGRHHEPHHEVHHEPHHEVHHEAHHGRHHEPHHEVHHEAHHEAHHGAHHGGHHGGHHESPYGSSFAPGSLGGIPNIPGLSKIPGLGRLSGMTRDGEQGSGISRAPPLPYSSRPDQSEPSYGPSSFPSIPQEPHSAYESSYAPPSSYAPSEPYGFSSVGGEYRGGPRDDYPGRRGDGGWSEPPMIPREEHYGFPPAISGVEQYGFPPAFPPDSRPHGAPHFPEYDEYKPGGW